MQFRTAIDIQKFPFDLTHADKVFLAGSCFAEKMQGFFHRAGFNVFSNSHGIIFDPVSLALTFNDVLHNRRYIQADLEFRAGDFVSLRHHGSFANNSDEVLLAEINGRINEACVALKTSTYCFITFGNAYAFTDVLNDMPVANCHRLPTQRFKRRMLDVNEIVSTWKPVLRELLGANPHLQVIYSVSPVRYLKDGAINNQISKANLLLAVHELCSSSDRVHYFPAYELMMDDLRDYRFYANDMIHPSEQAQAYIWQKLQEAMMSEKTRHYASEIADLMLFNEHRPRNQEAYLKQKTEVISRLSQVLQACNSVLSVDDMLK